MFLCMLILVRVVVVDGMRIHVYQLLLLWGERRCIGAAYEEESFPRLPSDHPHELLHLHVFLD
jgi:hypothetical protein